MCVNKIQDMQRFYESSQETQKFLAQQSTPPESLHAVNNGDILREDRMSNGADMQMQQLAIEEVSNYIESKPINTEITTSGLSTNKLLETAIKDTCILSEEDSGETDAMDDHQGDQAELSADFTVFTLRSLTYGD